MTNEKTVVEGIHSLFGKLDAAEPTLEEAVARKTGATGGEPEARDIEGMGDKIAKTSVFSAETDATGSQADEGLWAKKGARDKEEARSNKGARVNGEARADQGALGENGAATMAALEAVVRERLGLCWMRRAGRRPRPA